MDGGKSNRKKITTNAIASKTAPDVGKLKIDIKARLTLTGETVRMDHQQKKPCQLADEAVCSGQAF